MHGDALEEIKMAAGGAFRHLQLVFEPFAERDISLASAAACLAIKIMEKAAQGLHFQACKIARQLHHGTRAAQGTMEDGKAGNGGGDFRFSCLAFGGGEHGRGFGVGVRWWGGFSHR